MDYTYYGPNEGYDNTSYIHVDIDNDDSKPKSVWIYMEATLGVLMALTNAILIVGILLSKDLRSTSKHFQILSLCCVEFLTGAFNHQILAFLYQTRDTHYAETANDCGNPFIYYFTDISYACGQGISILMVSAIHIDWITMVTTKSYTPKDRKSLAVFMTVCIFIGSIIYVVSYILPIVSFREMCFLHYHNSLPLVLVVETPHLLFLALTTIFVIVGYMKAKSSTASPRIPLDILMASVLTFLFVLPSNVIMIISFYFHSVLFHFSVWEYMLILRLPTIKKIILPFVWLLDTKTRIELKRSLTCERNQRASVTENIE